MTSYQPSKKIPKGLYLFSLIAGVGTGYLASLLSRGPEDELNGLAIVSSISIGIVGCVVAFVLGGLFCLLRDKPIPLYGEEAHRKANYKETQFPDSPNPAE